MDVRPHLASIRVLEPLIREVVDRRADAFNCHVFAQEAQILRVITLLDNGLGSDPGKKTGAPYV